MAIIIKIEEITNKIINLYGDVFHIGKDFIIGPDGEKLIELKCKTCNPPHVWYAKPRAVLSKSRSFDCIRKTRKSYPEILEEVQKLTDQIHPNKGYIVQNISRNKHKQLTYTIYCPKHNHTWNANAVKYITNKAGCRKCSDERHQKHPTTIEEIQKLADQIHVGKGHIIKNIFKSTIVDSIRTHRYWSIEVYCPKHNHTWKTTVANYLTQKTGCPLCKASKGELEINRILTKHNIKFEIEYEYPNLVGAKGGSLRFDFYLPDYNACIEFQGEQHYIPIDYGSSKDSAAWKNFLRNVKHDNIKKNFCRDNFIKFLEIEFCEEFIEQKIIDFIKYINSIKKLSMAC